MRESVEQASLPLITRLSRLPRVVPGLVVLALMLAGAFIPGWGWVFLVIVLAILAWLAFLSWPRLRPPERLMRIAVLAMVAAIIVVRVLPR